MSLFCGKSKAEISCVLGVNTREKQSGLWTLNIRLYCLLVFISLLCADVYAQGDANAAKKPVVEKTEFLTTAQKEFQSLDKDQDKALSLAEFQNCDKKTAAILKRDFIVFDRGGNESLSFQEFQAIPYLVPASELEQTHSFIEMSDQFYRDIKTSWKHFDKSVDSPLNVSDFEKSRSVFMVSGLEQADFSVWDINHDQLLSLEEIRTTLDMAFGTRSPAGDLLRPRDGRVVDLRLYDVLEKTDGLISKVEYLKRRGLKTEAAEQLFLSIDTNKDEKLSLAEFLNDPDIWSRPSDRFLSWDTDLDGRLNSSELEKANMPEGQRLLMYQTVPAFDIDQDGSLSLSEFELIPISNLHTVWGWATDLNDDAMLDPTEFRFTQSVYLSAVTAFYFQRLDQNHDGLLSLDECHFKTSHPQQAFRTLDADGDQHLNLTEFLTDQKKISRYTRDFHILDFDADERLTYAEYASHPELVPNRHRTPVPDPVQKLIDGHNASIEKEWSAADLDKDGMLSSTEFEVVSEFKAILGLEQAMFSDWDVDGDGLLTFVDVNNFLNRAYGVTSEGVLIRKALGEVVDLRTYSALKDSEQGITYKKFALSRGSHSQKKIDSDFQNVDTNADQVISLSEWAIPDQFCTNTLALFLETDTNFNGRISNDEMELAIMSPGQKAMTYGTVAAFDEDGDGELNYLEFRMIPAVNMVVIWTHANDENGDGELTSNEFFQQPRYELNTLAAYIFEHLDRNRDGKLVLDEWPFITTHPRVKFQQADVNHDGELTESEFAALNPKKNYRLLRDSRLVDFDYTRTLSYEEFLLIPGLIPEQYRPNLPTDPLITKVDQLLEPLRSAFKRGDSDKNGSLNRTEFDASRFSSHAPDLVRFDFQKYDLKRDSQVTLEEFEAVFKAAFGVTTLLGTPLRRESGEVLDVRGFLAINSTSSPKESDEQFNLQDYLASTIGKADKTPQATFANLDQDANGMVSLAEWSLQPGVWVDPLPLMSSLDRNLDGRLMKFEFERVQLPASLQQLTPFMFPAFDTDSSGSIDLNDFRLSPLVNRLEFWGTERDTDHSGTLSFDEFLGDSPLTGLRAYYFFLLDRNKDNQLSHLEWTFRIDFAEVPLEIAFSIKDTNGDELLTFEELTSDWLSAFGGLPSTIKQGSHPKTATPTFDPKLEKRIMRAEEAFRRADLNSNEVLEPAEFLTDAGREVIAPGSNTLKKKLGVEPNAENVPLLAILGFNAVMIGTFVVFLFRKRNRRESGVTSEE